MMRKIPLLILFIALQRPLFCQPRYALVIGNSNYLHTTVIRGAVKDADLLESVLKKCDFNVTPRKDLSKKDFQDAIEQFFNKIKFSHSNVLFFYSGHGIQYRGENYLVPVDAELNSEADVAEKCVNLQYILDKLDNAKTNLNIIILDACRNFPKSWNKGEDDDKGLNNIAIPLHQSFIAFATAPSSVAADGGGTNSVFSSALAKYMVEPGLTIFQVFQKVYTEVRKYSANQYPWNNFSMDEEFSFINSKEFVAGPRKMEFLISEDCILYINNKKAGQYPGSIKFLVDNPPGVYSIRAVSQHDSSIYYDTTYHFDPANAPAENLMSIPLNNRIINLSLALKSLTDSIRYNMIRVEGGEFVMGSNTGINDEAPEHKVNMHSFSISKSEISQYQWSSIMGNNPTAIKKCANCPVDNISWDDAQLFIKKLNSLTGAHYRLPTESEWEYAARGGQLVIKKSEKFSGSNLLEAVGWFLGNSSKQSHPVQTKAANAMGISDMSGNMAEWCEDTYGALYYQSSPYENPTGPANGNSKVIRGGSWSDFDQNCRVTSRDNHKANFKDKTTGLRIASD
jgi:formylglycine-generating enzyme required for sulfatase activity